MFRSVHCDKTRNWFFTIKYNDGNGIKANSKIVFARSDIIARSWIHTSADKSIPFYTVRKKERKKEILFPFVRVFAKSVFIYSSANLNACRLYTVFPLENH